MVFSGVTFSRVFSVALSDVVDAFWAFPACCMISPYFYRFPLISSLGLPRVALLHVLSLWLVLFPFPRSPAPPFWFLACFYRFLLISLLVLSCICHAIVFSVFA